MKACLDTETILCKATKKWIRSNGNEMSISVNKITI